MGYLKKNRVNQSLIWSLWNIRWHQPAPDQNKRRGSIYISAYLQLATEEYSGGGRYKESTAPPPPKKIFVGKFLHQGYKKEKIGKRVGISKSVFSNSCPIKNGKKGTIVPQVIYFSKFLLYFCAPLPKKKNMGKFLHQRYKERKLVKESELA